MILGPISMRMASTKAKYLKSKADMLYTNLHFESTNDELKAYLDSRKEWFDFVFEKPVSCQVCQSFMKEGI